MASTTRFARIVTIPLLGLMLIGCGAGGVDQVAGPEAVESEPTGGEVSTVASFADVEDGVIRIVATGSHLDPGVGELVGSWTGTGFFIDPGGLAVTNNHVATGAAFLEVYVNGEDEPRTATVVGLDECSDLAVIQVEGDNFTTLPFRTDPFDVGLPVYSAGFPLGDPEYTLTRGIVSKRDADGDTSWTSVEAVLQHDARINGGNSGGPLVTEEGEVVGINFSRIDETDQNFAITAADARPLIDRLVDGRRGDSLGINAQAFITEDGLGGIFVQSVETGSAADAAGLEPGDLVAEIEGVAASLDGTMNGYCRILRGKGSEAELKLDVFRPSTGEWLTGNVNGDGLVVDSTVPVEAAADGGTVGAGGGGGSGPVDGSVVVDVDGTEIRIPESMAGWRIGTVEVGDQTLLVSVADDDAKRSTGLQGTPSAFDLHGVLFTYPDERTLNFWTYGVAMRIDVAMFDTNGRLVEIYRDLPPCRGDQSACSHYLAAGARYAITTPSGGLGFVDAGTTLVLG